MGAALDDHWYKLLLESIRKSSSTYASEISLWVTYCCCRGVSPIGECLSLRYPPEFQGVSELTVLRFLGLFRNGRSALKYVTAVRYLHQVSGAPTRALYSDRVCRALQAAKMIAPPVKRAIALQCDTVRSIATFAWSRNENDLATQCILAYQFGFRVLDELLPLEWDGLDTGGHSSVLMYTARNGRPLCKVKLDSRKNEPHGAELVRACTCLPWAHDPHMCPVHALVRLLRASARSMSGRIFPGVPKSLYTSFVRRLRYVGAALGFALANSWTSHGFRRGMAQDIFDNGGSLADILRAGGWKSAAFLLYLERAQVNESAILDCIFQHDEDLSEHTVASGIPREVRALLCPPRPARECPVPEFFGPSAHARAPAAAPPALPPPAVRSSAARPAPCMPVAPPACRPLSPQAAVAGMARPCMSVVPPGKRPKAAPAPAPRAAAKAKAAGKAKAKDVPFPVGQWSMDRFLRPCPPRPRG